MSMFIPSGKSNSGVSINWFNQNETYDKGMYCFFRDEQREGWVTLYRNKTNNYILPGAFDYKKWEPIGSYYENPWHSEFVQTGLIEGGNLSKSGDLTIDVAAGSGIVVDNESNVDVNIERLKWGKLTATCNFTSESTNYIFIDKNGDVQVVNNLPPEIVYRHMIYLGVVVEDPTNRNTIGGFTFAPYALYLTQQTMQDLHRRLFKPCMAAGRVSAVDSTMSLKHSLARVNSYAVNWANTKDEPHEISIDANELVSFEIVDRNLNMVSGTTNFIDPLSWDDNGVVSVVPDNNTTIQRLWYSIPLGRYYVQLGQNLFDSVEDAVDDYLNEPFDYNKSLKPEANAILMAYIVVSKSAVALSNTPEAKVISGGCTFGSGTESSIQYLPNLLDVDISAPVDDEETIVFNDTTKLWENQFPKPMLRNYKQSIDGSVDEFDLIYLDSNANVWKAAQANKSNTLYRAMAVNVDKAERKADIVFSGMITKPGHNHTVGKTYYLSDRSKGNPTPNKPNAQNSFVQPVFIAIGKDELLLLDGEVDSPDRRDRMVVYEDQFIDPIVGNFDPVYWNEITKDWTQARADSKDTLKTGVAMNVGTNTNGEHVADIVFYGVVEMKGHGLKPGSSYYLSLYDSGQVTLSEPNECFGYKQKVYTAISENELLIVDEPYSELLDENDSNQVVWKTREVEDNVMDFEPVYYDNSTKLWVKAVASSEETLKQGIATNVRECEFVDGRIKVADIVVSGFVYCPSHGLPVGTTYYLDAVEAGEVTDVPPVGEIGSPPIETITQAVFQVVDSDNIRVFDYQPKKKCEYSVSDLNDVELLASESPNQDEILVLQSSDSPPEMKWVNRNLSEVVDKRWSYSSDDFTPNVFDKTLVDLTANNVTMTLPDATDGDCFTVRIAKIAMANNLIVVPYGVRINGEMIDIKVFSEESLYKDLEFVFYSDIGWTVNG